MTSEINSFRWRSLLSEPILSPRCVEPPLRGTRRTVTDIAFDVGFSSSQYFATVFRRYTALAPEAWRRRDARPRRRILPEENLHPARRGGGRGDHR